MIPILFSSMKRFLLERRNRHETTFQRDFTILKFCRVFWPCLVIREGVLVRRFDSDNGKGRDSQDILPKVLRDSSCSLHMAARPAISVSRSRQQHYRPEHIGRLGRRICRFISEDVSSVHNTTEVPFRVMQRCKRRDQQNRRSVSGRSPATTCQLCVAEIELLQAICRSCGKTESLFQ